MKNYVEYYVKKTLRRVLNKLNIHAYDKFLIIPFMTAKEFDAFVRILQENKDKVYIEHGCGGSTIFADKFFKRYYSCDTDPNFVRFLNGVTKKEKIEYINVGAIREWGYPIEESLENAQRISRHFQALKKKEREEDYLVFIDGRCRVLTALSYVLCLKPADLLLVHDFDLREQYREILNYFQVIRHVDTLVVLRVNDRIDEAKLNAQIESFSQSFI